MQNMHQKTKEIYDALVMLEDRLIGDPQHKSVIEPAVKSAKSMLLQIRSSVVSTAVNEEQVDKLRGMARDMYEVFKEISGIHQSQDTFTGSPRCSACKHIYPCPTMVPILEWESSSEEK